MLNHGGKLREAALHYKIPVSDWLDLSTGVNARCYPVPDISVAAWNRLPEQNDGLIEAAQHYYHCNSLLPVAGSQAAIQALPGVRRQLFPDSRVVAVPEVGYREHSYAWSRQGYHVVSYRNYPDQELLDRADVVVVINPNNPTGYRVEPDCLLKWHSQLQERDSWLLVDEAFMDCTPEYSISQNASRPGMVVLRSVGKFFGLAGIRAGFVLATDNILTPLQERLGPWTLAGPSREICKKSLEDKTWQESNRDYLKQAGAKLQEILNRYFDNIHGTFLFTTVMTERAEDLHVQLCQQGIFTRLLDEKNGLRFGVPDGEENWLRLEKTLCSLPELQEQIRDL